tara:strand:+ start:143 stop:952 length:810 start_codon:yes stop_codon:yes gene_type:complete
MEVSKWRKYNGALIPVDPPHLRADISNIAKLIKDTESYFARWITEFDCNQVTEFWYVICDQFTPLDLVSRNTRSKIRRGLKKCSVIKVPKDQILENGFACYRAAFDNYSNSPPSKSKLEFKTEILDLEGEWDFWAVFHKDTLVGYSQNRIVDNCCEYSTIKFHPKYLSLYTSYILFFTMNKYYLDEMNFQYVNDGSRSLLHKTNIQDFLITKFGFRKAYCKLHIQYNYILNILVRFIYPFRFVFYPFNNRFASKINSLLVQEKIRRSFL